MNFIVMNFIELFETGLIKLTEEINLYKNEDDIWKIKDGISNSAGNLTLHLLGNLNHFIGAALGNTGYIRERDKEFSLRNIPRSQLIEDIKNTSVIIKNTLATLPENDLQKDFPLPINNKISSANFILMYLLTHFNYHLGQVNYLRRLIS